MTTAQVNARLDAEIKHAGDQALRAVGYAPTRAIKALWGFAGRHRHDPASLKDLLRTLEDDSQPGIDGDFQRKAERLREGQLIYERALQEMGVAATERATAPYEELLAQAHLEKEAERGLA